MRTDKYMMAKAWMKQDQAPQSEALETWNTLEAEFNEERKAMLMASAESDKIKAMMNEKYGPGTVKYGSEIPQPEIKTPQAIFEFSQRNPAAEGGRQGFDKGLEVKKFVAGSGPGTGSALEAKETLKKVKVALNKIKKQRNNKNLFEWSEKSDWYKKLQKDLGGMGEKGLNREYTNKLINQTVEEFFPGSYHGKNAIKNFRNDMVVKSFIQHLKSVGEFDGQEKFDKVLEQFKNPPKKGTPNNYESINKSWNDWRTGKFEVEGVDRAELKKELKARGIDYNKTIEKWTASGAQLRGKDKIKELKTLNKLNRFTNKSAEEIKTLFLKEHPNANFDLRVNELTQLKRNGVYVSGSNTELPVTGIEKGDRANWLKKAYGKQFAGNYSKIINAADQLAAAGETAKAERLYKAADKFFGPTGIIRKSAIGEAEHALARSFDFLNPDRQLAINSIVDGDLNQFKKNLFDIPVKQYVNEYNKEGTTKARKKELKNLIENRKNTMNALTGGQTKGIVAGDIVSFQYGDKITPTSSVKAIDVVFDEGKFDIDEYIAKGNAYGDALKKTGLKIEEFTSPIGKDDYNKIIRSIGCPNGVLEAASGGNCLTKGTELINSGMKGASPAALKNLAKLGPMLLKTGSAVMSGLIVPEALIVGLETAARVGLGDTPSEAILRATDYLTPDSFFGDFLQKADLMKLERTLGKDVANIAAQSFDRTNQSDKINKLEEKLKNLEAMTESGDFGYVGDLTNQINMTKDQIKQEKNKLKNTTQIGQEGRDLFTERALEDSYDASMAKSKFAAKKLMDSQSQNPRISATQAMQDMKPQEQLNKKQLPQRMLKGSAGEQAFLNLSQLPKGPRQGSEIDDLVTASNANFKSMGSDRRVDSSLLKYVQDLKQKEKDMSIADMVNVYGAESILGTQGNMGQPVERTGPGYMTNYKPLNRFGSQQRPVLYPKGRGQLAEGGITGLRSKYEYKK